MCVFAFTEEETSLRVLAAIYYYMLDFSRVQCECTVHYEAVFLRIPLFERTEHQILVCSSYTNGLNNKDQVILC